MDLYVVRHGRVISNDLKIVGSDDEELTEKGIEQALSMNKELQDISFDVVYCSPVLRAIQTANIIVPGKELILDARLAERNPGKMRGMSRKDIDIDSWNALGFDKTTYGAETLGAGLKRVKSFLEEIYSKDGDKTVLVVTHNFIIKCIWIIENEVQDMDQINSFYHKNDEIKHYSKYLGRRRG